VTVTHRWLALSTLGLFFFMVIVDGSIVTIAVPAMAAGLHVPTSQINLVIAIYLVGISGLLLTFGQLGDQLGRIRLFKWGTLLFTIGSALASLGISLPLVLGGRLVQAIGASMTMANSYAIVTDIFPMAFLGRALGVESIFISLGALAGPGLGGLILAYLSWHAIFWINIPLGLFCLIVAWRVFPASSAPAQTPTIDWPGTLWLITAAASFYVFTSTLLTQPVITLLSLGLFTVALVQFSQAERRAVKPLLDFAIFRHPLFSRSLLASFMSFIAAYFFTLLAPIYLQVVLHTSSQLTGLILMIAPAIALVANPIAGWLTDRYPQVRVMQWGMVLLVLAEIGLVLSNGQHEPWVLGGLSILISIGTAVFSTPSNTLIMSSVPAEQRGMAGATNSLTREFGMVLGTTLATTTYYGSLSVLAGRAALTVTGQVPQHLLHAQSVAYLAATILLVIGLWLIRSRKVMTA
jgi:MFS family permease